MQHELCDHSDDAAARLRAGWRAWSTTVLATAGLWAGPGTGRAGEPLLAVDWSNTDSGIVRLDSALGDPQPVGSAGFGGLNALARGPDGVYYSVDGSGVLVTIDPASGAGTAVATVDLSGPPVNVPGLAFSAAGTLYALNNGTPDTLYVIDIQTGVGVLVGPTGSTTLQALAFGPDGTLYGWDVLSGLYTLDPATGQATDVNPSVGADVEIQCLAFGPDGVLYGAHRNLYRVDPATGVPEEVALMAGVGIRGMAFTPVPGLRLRLSRQGADGVLCWDSETNRVYQIQQRAALGPTNDWNSVGDVIPGTGGELCRTNTWAGFVRFFRLRSVEIPAP